MTSSDSYDLIKPFSRSQIVIYILLLISISLHPGWRQSQLTINNSNYYQMLSEVTTWEVTLYPGDMVYIPAGVYHYTIAGYHTVLLFYLTHNQ